MAKWRRAFSDDNHMFVLIERIHSSASLNTNPTVFCHWLTGAACLHHGSGQAGGWGGEGGAASPGEILHQEGS